MREKVETLEKRLAALESEVATLRASRTPQPRAASHLRHDIITPAPSVSPAGPEDIAARAFAERHGLTRDSMMGWIKRGEIETTPHAIGRDASRTQHMLTPAQQRQAIQFWLDNNIAYAPCSACPHMPA